MKHDITKMTAIQLEKHYDEIFVNDATGFQGKCVYVTIDNFKYEVILDRIYGKWMVYVNRDYGELKQYIDTNESFSTMNKLIKNIQSQHKDILKYLQRLTNDIKSKMRGK